MRFIENIHSNHIDRHNHIFQCPHCKSEETEVYEKHQDDWKRVIEIIFYCNNCGRYSRKGEYYV